MKMLSSAPFVISLKMTITEDWAKLLAFAVVNPAASKLPAHR
jgi:hypothetical protein